MADSHSSGDYSDVVSRRKFVSLAGTTGAAAVAGCLGDDDGGGDDGDDGETDTGDSDMDTGSGPDQSAEADTDGGNGDGPVYTHEDIWFMSAGTAFSVDQFQYNPYVGWFIPHGQFGTWAPWARYLNVVDRFEPYLVQDWGHNDNNEFVLTLSEEFVWGDTGESITAEDLVLQLNIQANAGGAIWQFIDDATATGEYELTLSYPSETRQDFVTYSVLQNTADTPPSYFEGEEDTDNPADIDVPLPDPSGPLAVTRRTNNFHQYEPRDGLDDWADDPVAGDHYNWNGYRIEYRSDNNSAHQSFIASELDGIHSLFVGPSTLDQFPDSIKQYPIPGNFGMGIWPDHSDEPWNIREVRQAFYWSLDRNATIQNVGETTKVPHPAPTGLTKATVEPYLGSEEPDGFTVYEYNPDEAESLLSDAGYEPGDISASLAYPQGWSDWAIAAQSSIDQLQSVGWDINGDARSGGPGGYADDLGEGLDLAVDQHTPGGDASQNLPYFSLLYNLRNSEFSTRNSNSHFANYTANEVEVNGETVDIDATFDELRTASEDDRPGLIRQLALVVNKDVPVFYIMEKFEQSFIDTERFDVPESTPQENAFWPMWWLPQVDEKLESANEQDAPGLLKANTN